MNELPGGWLETEIGQVAEIETGGTPSKSNSSFFGGPYPFFKPGDLDHGGLLYEAEDTLTDAGLSAARPLPPGSLLVTCIGNLGKTGLTASESATNQQINAVLPTKAAEAWYLYYWSRTIRSWLEDNSSATTVAIINKGRFSRAPIRLAPVAEQRRIVAKLDALTARTARARADLDRIPALAARYKQVVLAKAFSGELTADWRTGKSNLMSARAVRAAVRESWEAAQAPISRRRGPIADPEAGRKPVELGPLPDTWVQMDLASVTDPTRLIQYGILKPGDHIDGGVPYVKVMNIKGGVVELDKIRRTTPEIHEAYRRSSLREGDLLLTIRGTVGRLAEVPAELDGGNITQDSVRIAVLPVVSLRFIYWFMHSPAAQEYFRGNQKGVAVRGINVGDVRPMEVAVCSREEQDEIVRRVDHAMVEIDRLVAEAAAARRLLDRLDQAILAKAFRGELVPQDPADEPASVLLDRIRAERAAAPKAKRGRKAAAA